MPKPILPLTIEATFPDSSPDSAYIQVRQDDAKLILIIPKAAASLLILASDQLRDQVLSVTIASKGKH